MNATTPIVIDGKEYPYYSFNLAISTKYEGNSEIGSAALRLVPTRVNETGNVENDEINFKSILLGSTAKMQDPEKTAVQKIQQALQEYIYSKGL